MKKLIIFSIVFLAACTVTKEQVGCGLGATAGAVAGYQIGSGHGQTAATVVGAGGGCYGGAYVGRQLDEYDKVK